LGDVLWYSLKDTPQFQAAAAKMPPTMPLDFVLGAINSAVLMACGIGFLLRQGWMRYLMLVMVLLMFFYEDFRDHLTIIGLIRDGSIYSALLWFVFTPKARDWFGAQANQMP